MYTRSDTGGPSTTAQALYGDAIYTEFYDDPEFIDLLFGKVTQACIRVAHLLKAAIGEKDDVGYHGSLFMARGAVRVVDDSSVSFSPRLHREVVMPRIRRVLAEFGGGWYHSCGYYPHLIDNLLAAPEITAINFGNPEMWPDLAGVIGRMMTAGKVYYGGIPVRAPDDLEPAMRRILSATDGERRGMIAMLKGDGPWPEPSCTMDMWHRLQDELCPEA